jgi:hypothetical protein
MQVRPVAVQLEAASHCQLRCPSCPTTQGLIHPAVGSGFLRLDDFRRFLDANPGVRLIELSNNGEIFLNPELLAILELAHQRGVALAANNGANLNSVRPEVLEGLVRYRLRVLTCALDGASQDTYQRYRVRGSFDRVIRNIRAINEHKRRLGSALPTLCWQFVVFGHNEHELPAAQRMAQELGMTFIAKLSWDDTFSPPRDLDAVRTAAGAASRQEFLERHGRAYMGGICHQLWDSPQINWDGRVLGCCHNTWGNFGGNAFTDGLVASVNGPEITYAREMLRGRAEPRADIPCSTCDQYATMRQTGRWIERDDVARGQALTIAEAQALAATWEAAGHAEAAAELRRRARAAAPPAERVAP